MNISDDIEDDTQTVEFQDRLVRYTAMTMTPKLISSRAEPQGRRCGSFAPDSEDIEAEIAFLLAVKRYQEFSDRYSARMTVITYSRPTKMFIMSPLRYAAATFVVGSAMMFIPLPATSTNRLLGLSLATFIAGLGGYYLANL